MELVNTEGVAKTMGLCFVILRLDSNLSVSIDHGTLSALDCQESYGKLVAAQAHSTLIVPKAPCSRQLASSNMAFGWLLNPSFLHTSFLSHLRASETLWSPPHTSTYVRKDAGLLAS